MNSIVVYVCPIYVCTKMSRSYQKATCSNKWIKYSIIFFTFPWLAMMSDKPASMLVFQIVSLFDTVWLNKFSLFICNSSNKINIMWILRDVVWVLTIILENRCCGFFKFTFSSNGRNLSASIHMTFSSCVNVLLNVWIFILHVESECRNGTIFSTGQLLRKLYSSSRHFPWPHSSNIDLAHTEKLSFWQYLQREC